MPQMSGKQLCDQIKSQLPQTKVLLMSGYTDDALAHHGVLDEGLSFLEKPFSPSGLARKVREVLDAKTGPASSRSRGQAPEVAKSCCRFIVVEVDLGIGFSLGWFRFSFHSSWLRSS